MASVSLYLCIEIMNSEIEIKIRRLIKDKLGNDESQITEDATFKDDLEVDSLDFTELIVSIEKEFKIAIPDDVYDKLNTVGALNRHVTKLVDPYGLNDSKAVKATRSEPEPEPEFEEQDTL